MPAVLKLTTPYQQRAEADRHARTVWVGAGEVATAVAALRQAADARARRAEVERERAEVRAAKKTKGKK